ncbi:hypothetical protein CPC08DRAFT_262668 [Agrocybe pediades]|nr:hypothetical protein CPC08DRAFT_262668 [Agrocybe pediades]
MINGIFCAHRPRWVQSFFFSFPLCFYVTYYPYVDRLNVFSRMLFSPENIARTSDEFSLCQTATCGREVRHTVPAVAVYSSLSAGPCRCCWH